MTQLRPQLRRQKFCSLPQFFVKISFKKKLPTTKSEMKKPEFPWLLIIDILLGDHPLVNGDAGDLHPAPKKNIIPKMKICWWVYTKRADRGLTTNKLKQPPKTTKNFPLQPGSIVIFWRALPKPLPSAGIEKKMLN